MWDFIKKSSLCQLSLAISFFTSGLIINFVQLILFCFVKPFNKKLFRFFMYYLVYSIHAQVVFLADWWAGCKLKMYLTKEDWQRSSKEHGLLLMNHYYEVDWLFGWAFCDKIGVLGNCKAITKYSNQFVPTVGWAWKFAEFIFVERNFQKDKKGIGNKLRNIFAYPHPVWFLLNAEGTRFTRTKHEASVKFAKERGLEPLEYHLIPRTKGFSASVPYLKEICPNVYDVNLAITKTQAHNATLPKLLNGEGLEAHMYIRRLDTKEIPDGEEKSAEWLQKLFREKDRFQQNFHKHGNFFHGLDMKPIEPITLKPRLMCLLNTVGWTFLTVSFLISYFGYLLFQGRYMTLSVGIAVLGQFYYLMNKAISYTQIEKGSVYGSTIN